MNTNEPFATSKIITSDRTTIRNTAILANIIFISIVIQFKYSNPRNT